MRKIDTERLASNLNYLVEHTTNYGIEKLSQIWFELFDIIESCRSLSTEELIFEVNKLKLIGSFIMNFSFFFVET